MRRPSWRAAGLAALLSLTLVLAGCGGDDDDTTTPSECRAEAGAGDLPGLQTGCPPWEAELDHLAERLDAIGLPALKQEGTAMDLHIQL